MRRLVRYSEPYSPIGSVAAEGIRNQLGRPPFSRLELLVREAIQNSWDAKRPEAPTVRAEIRLSELDPSSTRSLVLSDPPPGLDVDRALSERPSRLLTFADFGTAGLGGPLRADVVSDEHTDFADFVRNVGQPPDKAHGGGSFGYGKGAFYLASAARTIIVHSRCRTAGQSETRLIVCAIGDHYEDAGTRYTGRHWWGVIADDGIIDPVVGEAADDIADSLGLPARRDDSAMGTSVAIVAPLLGHDAEDVAEDEGDAEAAMAFVAECLTWNFWPKMVAQPLQPAAMDLRAYNGARAIPVPDPRDHPQLGGFVEALEVLRSGADPEDGLSRYSEVRGKRPNRQVGQIALRRWAVGEPTPRGASAPMAAIEMRDSVHHTALIRDAELIVKYVTGPPLSAGPVGYAGVFKAAHELDQVFRASEPPSHDDWVAQALDQPWDRRAIRAALRGVSEAMEDFAGGRVQIRLPDAGSVPLGEFCDQLAGLMPASSGPGARSRPVAPRSGSGASRSDIGNGSSRSGTAERSSVAGVSVSPIGIPRPVLDQGRPRIQAAFTVDARSWPVLIRARPQVLTLDGSQVEGEPPAGTEAPSVVCWVAPDGARHGGEQVEVPRPGEEWLVLVSHVADAMVRIELTGEPIA